MHEFLKAFKIERQFLFQVQLKVKEKFIVVLHNKA